MSYHIVSWCYIVWVLHCVGGILCLSSCGVVWCGVVWSHDIVQHSGSCLGYRARLSRRFPGSPWS